MVETTPLIEESVVSTLERSACVGVVAPRGAMLRQRQWRRETSVCSVLFCAGVELGLGVREQQPRVTKLEKRALLTHELGVAGG